MQTQIKNYLLNAISSIYTHFQRTIPKKKRLFIDKWHQSLQRRFNQIILDLFTGFSFLVLLLLAKKCKCL